MKIRNVVFFVFALGALTPAHAQHQQRITLAEAVTAFNARAAENPIGKHEPALTDEAVVAAVRWAMLDRDKLQVSNDTFRELGEFTRTRVLPKNFDLEAL